MNKRIITSFLLFFSVLGFSQDAENYLQTEKALKFDNENYGLVWSSHPNKNYYKQEYLTAEQSLEKYKSMILIDFVKGDFSVKDAVNVKLQELEKAKELNLVVSYTVLEKGEDTMIDFLMAAKSNDGKEILIVERNVYRYVKVKTKQTNGVLVFAVSEEHTKVKLTLFLRN